MTDNANPSSPEAAPPPADAATPAADAGPKPARVREAITLIKEHPLGAVATVAAATALLEIEFAVGVLAIDRLVGLNVFVGQRST